MRSPGPVPPLEVWILPADQAHAALTHALGGARLQRTAEGKPWVRGGPHFNLSHSGELALLALCPDVPVGIDLEAHRELRNPTGLARRMCSPRELAHLTAAPDLTTALLGLWVRKEAVAKAEGEGLATALSGIDVLDPVVMARGRPFHVLDLPAPAPGYHAAVAWAAQAPGHT